MRPTGRNNKQINGHLNLHTVICSFPGKWTCFLTVYDLLIDCHQSDKTLNISKPSNECISAAHLDIIHKESVGEEGQ